MVSCFDVDSLLFVGGCSSSVGNVYRSNVLTSHDQLNDTDNSFNQGQRSRQVQNDVEQICKVKQQQKMKYSSWLVGWFKVFNATFNNISVISWMSILLVEETRVTGENHVVVSKRYINIIFLKMLSHLITMDKMQRK